MQIYFPIFLVRIFTRTAVGMVYLHLLGLQKYRCHKPVLLYACKPLFIVAYVFFEVVADNLAYGHAFLRGDDFEF